MGQIQKQLFFKAPVEKVWNVWVEVDKTTDWVEGVEETEITSATKSGKGLAWKEKCAFGKKVIQMDHEFVEWDPLKRTVIHSDLPMGGTMDRIATFKPSPEGTEVNIELEWDLGIVGAFFDEGKLHHMMEKSFDLTAQKWKEKAERS